MAQVGSPISEELWGSLLDAEMNVRYWGAMCHRYARYDLWSRVFLAVSSSSTVASWQFWAQVPLLWKSLSGLSALLAIMLTIVDLPKKVSRMSVLAVRWKHSHVEYQMLWQNDRALTSVHAKAKYDVNKQREVVNTGDEHTLPYDRKLLARCYQEVCIAHGLSTKEEK